MTGDDFASFLYLSLLAAVIGGYFLLQNRHRLGSMAQQAAIWALIFIGFIAAIGLWEDVRRTGMSQHAVFAETGEIAVPRAPNGHYYVTLDVNGAAVRFIVDTGATDMVLSISDAERAGIDTEALRFHGRALTANGEVQTAPVRLDHVRLGPVIDTGVLARVSTGQMPGSLLGMAYLDRFSSITISGERLTLTR